MKFQVDDMVLKESKKVSNQNFTTKKLMSTKTIPTKRDKHTMSRYGGPGINADQMITNITSLKTTFPKSFDRLWRKYGQYN